MAVSALTIAEVLDRAADLIEPEGAWTQGVWARNDAGIPTSIYGRDAICFCMRGALVRTANAPLTSDLPGVQGALGFKTASAMARWNDRENRTQAEVVAKLREAAALAREQGA